MEWVLLCLLSIVAHMDAQKNQITNMSNMNEKDKVISVLRHRVLSLTAEILVMCFYVRS